MKSPGSLAASVLLLVTSIVTLTPTAALAQLEGSAEQLPFPELAANEFIGEHFSADLSTAAFTQDSEPLVREPAVNAGITTIIDLATGELRLIQPDRGPSDQVPLQLDGDGSHLLISANWEGVVVDDADDGASDLFLVDTAVDDVVALSAGITAEAFDPIGVSDDALTVVFGSGEVGAADQLHLWQSDTVTVIPTVGVLDSSQRAALSGDGTTLLYSTTSGTDITWHVHDLATGVEQTILGTSVFGLDLSSDGSVVAAIEADADPLTSNAVVWQTSETELVRFETPGADAVLSSNGSALFGRSNRAIDADEVKTVWRLDIATGQVDTVLETSQRLRGVVAVSADGDSIVVHTTASAVGQRPVTIDFFSDEIEAFFLVDLTRTPAPVPGFSGTLDDQLVRLYRAFLDRAPDDGGLEFWRNQRIRGLGLFEVSAAFAQSPEFIDTYGDLDDEAFIDLVYLNVLDRAPDEGGQAFWLDELANGRERGTVMALFNDSPEFVESTGTLPPESATAASVRRLYAGYFGRSADPSGLAFWVGQAEDGVSLENISETMRLSDELAALYGIDASDSFVLDLDDPLTIARIGLGNTQGIFQDVIIFPGDTSAAEAMITITNSAEFVALTSSTPVGD